MMDLKEAPGELISSSPILLLQFGDNACGPCGAIRRRLDLWLRDRPEVTARYVELRTHLEVCSRMGIFSVPTILVWMDGRTVARESGYFSLDGLLDRMDRLMEMRK